MQKQLLDGVPELSFHLDRLSPDLGAKLVEYGVEKHWLTKDLHQISTELEEFINQLHIDEISELLHLQAKLFFFSGNLTKLNDLYTMTAASEEIAVPLGVQTFYALSLAFQGFTNQSFEILEQINLDQYNHDPILKLETMGVILFIYSIKRAYKLVSEKYNDITLYLNRNFDEPLDLPPSHALMWALLRQAYSIRAQGKTSDAIKLLKKTQDKLLNFPHRYFQVMVLTRLGHCYHNVGQLDEAIDYYDRAIDLGQEIQAWILLSILYNRVGMAMMGKRKNNLAKEYFQKAMGEASKGGASWLTIGPLVNLAQWKLAQGKINEAITDYETFARIAEGVGDQQELCYAQLGLAELYERVDDQIKARFYFQKGVQLGLKLGILKVIPQSEDDPIEFDS